MCYYSVPLVSLSSATMSQSTLLPNPVAANASSVPRIEEEVKLRPSLLLGSIVGLVCLGLDVSVIEQTDSLSLYMTYGEIAVDVGIGLLLFLAAGLVWWLIILASVGIGKPVFRAKVHRWSVAWYAGLLIPFSYLVMNSFGAVKEAIFPNWHSELLIWWVVLLVFVIGMFWFRVSRLQEFCRTRLLPVAWFHSLMAAVALIALPVKGVHLFKNYAHSAGTVAASSLPDIYLITADALSMDDTSLSGYQRPTTPNLERFARRSFSFEYFFANSNFTATSTTSIETGKLPWSHRVFQQGGFLRGPAQAENLARVLQTHGYYTAMIASNQWAAPFRHRTLESYDAVQYIAPLGTIGAFFRYTNLVGANTQYTLYAALMKRLTRGMSYVDARIWPERYPYPAEEVFEEARSIVERPDIKQPRFIWTHIFPPHDPYLPPPQFRAQFLTEPLIRYPRLLGVRNGSLPPHVSATELRAQYDELVLYADQEIGNFLDWLDSAGRLDNAIVIITADHGESFDHTTFLHAGPGLYDELIHVPLLIHTPGLKSGSQISVLAEQVDILPTILSLIEAPVPSWAEGASLRPVLYGHDPPQRYAFTMNLEPDSSSGPVSKGTLAVMDDEYKYVLRLDQQRETLYRYRIDPREQDNLVASEPEARKRLRGALLANLEKVNHGR